ncbi:hypothetical protein GC175_22270 [bacterium]|nr:hypothetical protein [bacterium]
MIYRFRPGFWRMTGLSLGVFIALCTIFVLSLRSATAQLSPLTVTADPATPIQIGENAAFTITLENPTAVNRTLVLSVTLDGPIERSRFVPLPAASQGVTTLNTLQRDNALRWRGEIAAGGKLTLRADVRSNQSDTGEIVLAAATGPALDNLLFSAQGQVTVEAPPTLSAGDLLLTQSVFSIDADPNAELIFDTGSGLEVLNGDKLRKRNLITNTTGSRVFALITGSLQPQSARATFNGDDVCRARILGASLPNGQGTAIPAGVLTALQSDYGFVVTIEPGQAALLETQVQTQGGVGCVLTGETVVRARALPANFQGVVMPQLKVLQTLAAFSPIAVVSLPWAVVASDYGDAPDSKYIGHASFFDMVAYLNPITSGNFPTSYYVGKPAPQGPKHQFVNPLHLGDGFSLERWADRGPRRNIDPVTLTSDLDLNDDGIDPNNLTLQHCVPTSIPFQVTITQDAVDRLATEQKNAYVNIWLDGNRDGDWADTLDCDGIEAREHIVIDQVLAPAAGGVYNLMANTGNLPIPQNQCREMWLRVTLSDEPSVKLPGLSYGDGRGPDSGFRLGETEDYLVIPVGCDGSSLGVDLSLDMEARVQWEPTLPNLGDAQSRLTSSTIPSSRPVVLQRIRVKNEGGLAAGGKLIIENEPFLGMPTYSGSSWTGCLTCTRSLEMPATLVDAAGFAAVENGTTLGKLPLRTICPQGEGNCYLEMDLPNNLQPGQLNTLILGWKVEEGVSWKVEEGEALRLNARIETVGDVKTDNNLKAQSVRPAIRPLTVLYPPAGVYGITEPLTATVQSSHMADAAWVDTGRWHFGPLTATLKMRLFGQPGSSFGAKVGGADVGSGTFNSSGLWSGSFALPTGDANLSLIYQSIPGYTENEVAGVNQPNYHPLRLSGDLPWNPGSLKVTPHGMGRSGGDADEPPTGLPVVDEAGLAVTDGWRLPVRPGQETNVGVDLNCHGPGYAALRIDGGDLIPLTNVGEGHRYTGAFTSTAQSSQPVELIVGCHEPEEDHSTHEGRVTMQGENQADPCGGTYEQCWVFSGMTEVVPQATLLDGTTGEPIAGAAVQLWRFRRDAGGIQAESWPGAEYGQQNPVVTGADGKFAFVLSPGFYGVTIAAEGYQPFRGGPFRLCCHFPPNTITLQPQPAAIAGQEITLGADGFVRGQVRVDPGATVRFVNLSLDYVELTDVSGPSAAQATATAFRGGLIAPGESYLVTFGAEGRFTIANGEDLTQQVVVVVAEEEPEEVENRLFLPSVLKRGSVGALER